MKFLKDYHYEYRLPKECDLDKITSKRNSDGTLVIEAVLPPKSDVKDDAVEIPIEKS